MFCGFSGDPTNRMWVRAEVQLNSRSSFRVGFEGIVGGDDKTDIALDDISFSAGCYLVRINPDLNQGLFYKLASDNHVAPLRRF